MQTPKSQILKLLEDINKQCKETTCGNCKYSNLCDRLLGIYNGECLPDEWEDFISKIEKIGD